MHEDDEEVEDDPLVELPARQVRPLDFVIALWALFGSVAEVVYMFFEHVTRLLVMHRNHHDEQRGFAEAVRSDIESIPSTNEE